VDVKLLRHLVDIAPPLAGSAEVAIIDERQVQLPILLGTEEFPLVAKVGEVIAVPGNAGIQAGKLAKERVVSTTVFRIEAADLRVEQVPK